MRVKVSPKYQVVIPKGVREMVGLRPGMIVDVLIKGRAAIVVPVKSIRAVSTRVRERLNDQDLVSLREKKDRKV